MSKPSSCKICAGVLTEHYSGPIRMGKPGNISRKPHQVWRCQSCDARFLPGEKVDYQSGEYRKAVDADDSPEGFYQSHDALLWKELGAMDPAQLRGSRIMDIGAGAGSVLDFLKGIAESTLAIEPQKNFQEHLRKNGHLVFSKISDLPEQENGQIDYAFCQSVLEHLEDPVQVFAGIYQALKPGGQLYLTTPNANDWLLDLIPESYGVFFYRQVHRWYFSDKSLHFLANQAGFRKAEIGYRHRFDLSNLIGWLIHHKPTGVDQMKLGAGSVDEELQRYLVNSGRADYLVARLTK